MKYHLLGFFYIVTRFFLAKSIALKQVITEDITDFEEVIEVGERLAKSLNENKTFSQFITPQKQADQPVQLYDLTFPNPITFSSFQHDINQIELWLKLGIGGGILKTILKEPRKGNDQPRIVDLGPDDGLINAYGLPGPGIEAFLLHIKQLPVWSYNRPIGISIGGHSVSDYKDTFLAINESLYGFIPAYFYELNLSCPNTKEGKALADQLDQLEQLLKLMRQHTDKVIGIKVSPDMSNLKIAQIADCAKTIEKTYINAGNTRYKSCVELGLDHHAISIGGGGQSGPPLFERTCEMIDVLKPLNIPIIATGGITTPTDVKIALNKGATFVGMATALVKNPFDIPLL